MAIQEQEQLGLEEVEITDEDVIGWLTDRDRTKQAAAAYAKANALIKEKFERTENIGKVYRYKNITIEVKAKEGGREVAYNTKPGVTSRIKQDE